MTLTTPPAWALITEFGPPCTVEGTDRYSCAALVTACSVARTLAVPRRVASRASRSRRASTIAPAGRRHVIGDGQQVQVLWADLLLVERLVPDPLQQPVPVVLPVQDDGEVLDLASLDQGQRLEQLIQRAEAARR